MTTTRPFNKQTITYYGLYTDVKMGQTHFNDL